MKNKIFLVCVTVAATVLIISLVAMKKDPMKEITDEAKTQVEEAVKAIGLEDMAIVYNGLVDDQSFNQGRAEFVCDGIYFYYDLERQELAYIYNSSHRAGDTALSQEELRNRSDALLAAVKGDRILQLCREREKTEPKTDGEYRCYINEISISVADIELDDSGKLICAAFQITDIPELEENGVTPDRALTAAKESAEKFLKKKHREDMTLDENSVSVTRSLVLGEDVYVCEMSYRAEGSDIPCYFRIVVNADTGRVQENANSFS